jgi:exodeoxyribonuclease VII small subunit
MAQEQKKTKKTFEQALAELEKIVEQIEQGEVPLEESIEKYGQGLTLIRQCRSILDQAEQKIQLLAQTEDGRLETRGELPEDSSEEAT